MKNILVIKSLHSFKDSVISIDDAIQYATKNNISALALADNGNSFMHQEFISKCEENNIKPILGITISNDSNDVTLLAKNIEGYNEIAALSSNVDSKTNTLLFPIDSISDNIVIANDDSNFKIVNRINSLDDNILTAIGSVPSETSLEDFKEFSFNNDETTFTRYNIDFDIPDFIPPWVEQKYNNNLRDYLLDEILPNFEHNYFLDNGLSVPPEFYNAVKNELSSISETGFQNYFITNAEILKTANDSDVASVLRGSAVSSAILYMILLSTTDNKISRSLYPNPVEHHLNFSRFLNPERSKRPDIDIDLSDQKKLISNLSNKYSDYTQSSLAFVPSVSVLHNKNKITKIVSDVLEKEGLDTSNSMRLIQRALASENPTDAIRSIKTENYNDKAVSRACDVFNTIYNTPQSHTCNASSVVISPIPFSEHSITTKFKDSQLLGTLKDSVDNIALKFDLLSNKYLEKMKTISAEIPNDEYDSISDEVAISNIFSTNSIDGMYQISGNPHTKSMINAFNISSFTDLTSAIALIRPAVSKDERDAFIRNQDGINVNMYSDSFDDIKEHVSDTRGIILYQDQVMAIARSAAGFSDGASDDLRVTLSKNNESNIESLRNSFIYGDQDDIENKPGYIASYYIQATADGIEPLPKDTLISRANGLFDVLKKSSGYSFNHSHALAYAKIITSQAKLKLLRPAEFSTHFNPTNTELSVSDLSNLNIKKLDFNIHDFDTLDRSYTTENNGIVTAYIKPGLTSLNLSNQSEIGSALTRASSFIKSSDTPTTITKDMILVSAVQQLTQQLDDKIPQHKYDLLVEKIVSIKSDLESMNPSMFDSGSDDLQNTMLSVIKHKLPIPTKQKKSSNRKFNKNVAIYDTPINVVIKALEREGVLNESTIKDSTEIMTGNIFNKIEINLPDGKTLGPIKVMMDTENTPVNGANDLFWHDWSTMSGGKGATSFLSYLSSQSSSLPDLSSAKSSASYLHKLLNEKDLSFKPKKVDNFIQNVELPPVVPKPNTFFNSLASDYLTDRGFSKKTIGHMLSNGIVYGAKYQSHKDKFSSPKVVFPSSNSEGKVSGQIINGRNQKTDSGFKFTANSDFKKQNLAGGMAGSFCIPSKNPTECILCEGAEDAIALWELRDSLGVSNNADIHAVFGTGHLNQFLEDLIGVSAKIVNDEWLFYSSTKTTKTSPLTDKDISDIKASLQNEKTPIDTIYIMDKKLLDELQPLSSICDIKLAPDFETDKFYSGKNIFRLNSSNYKKFLSNNNLAISDGELVRSIEKTTLVEATESDFVSAKGRFVEKYGVNPTLTLAFDNDSAGEAFIPLIESISNRMGINYNIVSNQPPFPKDHNEALIEYNLLSPQEDRSDYIREYLRSDCGMPPEKNKENGRDLNKS